MGLGGERASKCGKSIGQALAGGVTLGVNPRISGGCFLTCEIGVVEPTGVRYTLLGSVIHSTLIVQCPESSFAA